MDNKEVLVKLHFVTKYGVPISSYKVIKNYTLYKYLVITHLVDKIYIDYSNEDCEIVDVHTLFKNSKIIDDKNIISSYNNIKHILLENDIHNYNLFSLIDMTYSDTFGFTVENDSKFQKYSEFYKLCLDLTKKIILKYSNKQDCPKNINELLTIELGTDFNILLNFLNEPIDNENNIIKIINKLNNKLLDQTSTAIINNFTENSSGKSFSTETNKQKDKVIISKNQHGLYTFKDLIFDMKTGFVTGKWNGYKLDYLTEEDINLCKSYNLKYIDIKICNNFVKVSSNNTELNNTSIDLKDDFKNILNGKIEQSITKVEKPTEEQVEEPIDEPTEEQVEEPIDEPTEEPVEEPVEEPTEEPVEEPIEEPIEEQKVNELEKITETLSEIINENTQETVQNDNEQSNIAEPTNVPTNESILNTIEPLNPNSIIGVLKPLDIKPSRGRRKISAATSTTKARK
jgi:hypothetical protein